MTVLEYANDVDRSIDEIFKICQKMNIKVSKEDDMLSDDDIIILDNELENTDTTEEEIVALENFDEQEFEDSYEEELEEVKVVATVKKKKKNPKKENNKNNKSNKNNEFKLQKKEMYKHKEKLQSNINTLDDSIVLYTEGMSVAEFANVLGKNVAEIIKKLMGLGKIMNLNAAIDFETAEILALEYNKTLKRDTTRDESNFEELEIIDDEKDLVERPPVITIMGHVDHGKTTLLDTIRNANVVAGEAGGITQHIGAYQIVYNGKPITFIDTPGHAAFTEMRARGASVTDIVIIIVAADDGVMPQTKEAIDHAKAAGVPIVVAVNKIDKPGANPERVMTEMSQNGITPDVWGGDTLFVNISAKNGDGIDELLENLLLISEMQELKANPNRYASGTVIESKIDKYEGVVSTVLIQNGTLRLGDAVVVGNYAGKIRTLKNDKGENLVEAGPSMPVSITGISESPSAGDKFMAFENEKKAKSISEQRILLAKKRSNKGTTSVSLDDLFNRIEAGEKEINVVLKADVKGSEEAVKNSLQKLDVEGIRVNVIRSSIGAISESDIVLAAASNAIIIGFNIRPNNKIVEYAKEKGVDIRLYNIIYKVVEEMEAAMKGKLDPIYEEKVLGRAEVRRLFKFSKVGTIAGSYVLDGIIRRDAKARIIRDDVVIYDGNINSIAREKDQVKEVKQGLECGITIENYNDIKEGDVIEAYEIVEVKR
ncbi:MAG: translation initiation factor IF-2 [Erysipelotrichaceae bacterium]|nr:translation initiation factor IF-2 [Erysipelotrichaceae bacterium]MDD6093448.1 translation initiation factor IF-2 [bacterium]